MRYKADDGVACPNCKRTDGYHDTAQYVTPDRGYLPATVTTVFCCSHCVVPLQAQLNREYPRPKAAVA